MDYSEYFFYIPESAADFAADVLPSFFEDSAFESFETVDGGMKAYAPNGCVDDESVKLAIEAFVSSFPMADGTHFTKTLVADRNWNETWERESFHSLSFGDSCVVHSPSESAPSAVKYDILIDPKQSFGSGSHETTTLMINRILSADMQNKSVVDVGCGTAILAILSKKKGAGEVAAFDIDKWAYENAKTNLSLNNIDDIDLRMGGFEVMSDGPFDFILANITRNILLDGLAAYSKVSKKGTRMFMSGFFPADVELVKAKCASFGFQMVDQTEMNGWASVECVKL